MPSAVAGGRQLAVTMGEGMLEDGTVLGAERTAMHGTWGVLLSNHLAGSLRSQKRRAYLQV